MSFLFVLSDDLETIDFARVGSDRYIVFTQLTENIISDLEDGKLVTIKLDYKLFENQICEFLRDRVDKRDVPDYKGRFDEDDVFSVMQFGEQIYKLCNSGFDNKVIFLINIFNAIKDIKMIKVLIVKNHRDYRNWKVINC